MKALIFQIGKDRYGLRLSAIARVLPSLELKQLPLAPDYVAGLMDLHGTPVPVIDLCRLAGLAPSADFFDTRIVVADYRTPQGAVHPLGLLCQHVRGVREVAAGALADSGLTLAAAPFLGQVASDTDGMLQLVEIEHLLPATLRAMLFQHGEAGA